MARKRKQRILPCAEDILMLWDDYEQQNSEQVAFDLTCKDLKITHHEAYEILASDNDFNRTANCGE